MQNEDEDLEKYLSDFQPRDVRPLEVKHAEHSAWIGRLAAAAVVVLSVGTGLWYSRHRSSAPRVEEKLPVVRIEFHIAVPGTHTILLTKMALENPKQFDEEMNEESRLVLPELRGQQSTLSVLAKE